jgi:hypothetical protein
MEEDTAPPRRNDTLLLGGMRATRSSSMRFHRTSWMYGGAARPTSPLDMIIRSTSTPWYSNGFIIMTEEEEEKLAHIE